MTLRPPTITVRRSCMVKGLDVDTAYAVVIGPPEHPNLFGVRATKPEALRLAKHVKHMGSEPQVTRVAVLLGVST